MLRSFLQNTLTGPRGSSHTSIATGQHRSLHGALGADTGPGCRRIRIDPRDAVGPGLPDHPCQPSQDSLVMTHRRMSGVYYRTVSLLVKAITGIIVANLIKDVFLGFRSIAVIRHAVGGNPTNQVSPAFTSKTSSIRLNKRVAVRGIQIGVHGHHTTGLRTCWLRRSEPRASNYQVRTHTHRNHPCRWYFPISWQKKPQRLFERNVSKA